MKISSKYYVLCIKGFLSLFLYLILNTLYFIPTAHAIYDPLSVPNNKFGIHIISASVDESAPAADLVNNNGDWGYVTVLMEQKDKKLDKWQEFFNDLRRRHLIPIIRLATEPEGNNWKRPDIDDVNSWADFLNSLVWPVKNRYVVVFNEPNHATEWGGQVDAKGYAKELDKIITALKSRSEDFFVMNAGFDASAPNQPPNFEEEISYLQQMNQEVPGIFDKLDGWDSHSYPNPEFVGSPDAQGRGTVRGYLWELGQLQSLGVTKNLPVFITETGWKHAEGLNYNSYLPNADTVASYYKSAFETAWNDTKIAAVTPFLLNYQEPPFDHFSFKKVATPLPGPEVSEIKSPQYYTPYQTLSRLPKVSGKPIQEISAQLTKGEVYTSIIAGESYKVHLTFKNTGQSIWGDPAPGGAGQVVKLIPVKGAQDLGIIVSDIPLGEKVEPGQSFTFDLEFKAPKTGQYQVTLNLFHGADEFQSQRIVFTTEVKSPVILRIKSVLGWKNDPSGNYLLSIKGPTGENLQQVSLDHNGYSKDFEARNLLPDYSFDFTLEKPFYLPKTINQIVYTGANTLDFGELKPDILSALLNPKQLWNLLPFSN